MLSYMTVYEKVICQNKREGIESLVTRIESLRFSCVAHRLFMVAKVCLGRPRCLLISRQWNMGVA